MKTRRIELTTLMAGTHGQAPETRQAFAKKSAHSY
jgi:hypothetical protein